MIGRLVALDLQLLRRSPAAWATLLALVAAAALALWNGLDWRDRYVRAAEPARAEAAKWTGMLRETWEGLEAGTLKVRAYEDEGDAPIHPGDPYIASYFQTQIAELPPGPLLGLATGASELRPTHHPVRSASVTGLVRIGGAAERVNPTALAQGRFDLLAFMLLLCPLALIALLFDAAAREREGGLAPLLASAGVDRRALLAARGLTRGGLVLGVALAATAVGAPVVGAPPPAALVFAAGAALYVLFWTALLLALASTGLSAAGVAGAGVAVWMTLTLLAPALVERAVRPDGLMEARARIDPLVRGVFRERTDPAREEALIEATAPRFWNRTAAEVPACARRPDRLVDYASREWMDAAHFAAAGEAMRLEVAYDRALDSWGVLLPTLAFRRAVEAVAGVDPARQRAFEEAVYDYHRAWRRRAREAVLTCRDFTRADFDDPPRFAWVEPPARTGTIAGGLASIALCAGLFGLIALRRRPL